MSIGLEGHIGGHWLIWEQQTGDERALHKPGNTKERLAACWYGWDKPLYIKIRMDKASRRAIALYLLDWDTLHGGRAGKVEVLDPTDNHVLDSRGIDEYDYGRYIVWNVNGPVTFKLTSANMASTALSGVFIDEPVDAP